MRFEFAGCRASGRETDSAAGRYRSVGGNIGGSSMVNRVLAGVNWGKCDRRSQKVDRGVKTLSGNFRVDENFVLISKVVILHVKVQL